MGLPFFAGLNVDGLMGLTSPHVNNSQHVPHRGIHEVTFAGSSIQNFIEIMIPEKRPFEKPGFKLP